MVASLCGIILTPNENHYNADNRFLPSATCLGDLLKSVGYYNVYIGGAPSEFTGKGKLTKAFMEYLKNIPEGKVGNKNEFLTQMGRRTGPGQYSSFFSALGQAGITARQGKSGLVKGINFDKFYKKVFE